jgi:phosphoserine phosphatase RsbU/P
VINEVPEEDETSPAPAQQPATRPGNPPQNDASAVRYAWFRLHVQLPPNHGPLSLLILLPISTYTSFGLSTTGYNPDVYANGQLIRPQGPHAHTPNHFQLISRIYNFNVPPSQTSLVLVLRTRYIAFGYGAYTNFFSNRALYLGNPDDLQRELTLWSDRSLFERLPRLIYSVLLAVLAVFLFALYFAQKGHPEYLWLAVHELIQAPLGFIELAGSSAQLDSLLYAALVLQLFLVSAYLFFEFLVAFLSLPRRWYIRWLRYTAPILAFVGPMLYLMGHGMHVGPLLAIIALGTLLWLLGWSIFVFLTLIAATLRRNFEAGLLLVPLILTIVGMVEPVLTAAMSQEGVAYQSPLTVMAGPIPIHFASIANFTGILVIILIIFFRFLRVQREQERASSELAAARSVQELLIPQEKLSTPGFEVESIYSPANEVGGDFFHVQSAGHEGMVVVIGDVAGHGLKAAMNVSLIMGALRRTHERSPGKILKSLNRVLVGTEGFTTCQALWFGASGEMIIANAGHLFPYLNSQEITLPGGLPLGILPEVNYEEMHFYLHPGDRILLLSDGVVEARQPSGELFGFERVRYMSQQRADSLAQAAKVFGQQDDITVLTVRREAKAVAA